MLKRGNLMQLSGNFESIGGKQHKAYSGGLFQFSIDFFDIIRRQLLTENIAQIHPQAFLMDKVNHAVNI